MSGKYQHQQKVAAAEWWAPEDGGKWLDVSVAEQQAL